MRIVEHEPGTRVSRLRLWIAPSWPSTPAPTGGRCVEWCGRQLEPTSYALLGLVHDPNFDASAFDQDPYRDTTASPRDQVRFGLSNLHQSIVRDWLEIWGVQARDLFGAEGEISSSEIAFAIATTFLARTDEVAWEGTDKAIQAEWDEAARLVSVHYQYVRKYRQALEKLGTAPSARHRVVSSVLGTMPPALRSLYFCCGDHPLNLDHNRLLNPASVLTARDKLVFLKENQMSVVWAIDVASTDDDPTVWQGQPDSAQEGGYRWYAEDNPLSDFIIEMWEWLADQQ